MIFSFIFQAFFLVFAQAATFQEAIQDLEKVWPQRVEMAKQEDQLILNNMQLATAISRLVILSKNLKTNPDQSETTRAIYESTVKIIERYEAMYNANEAQLQEIYSKRKRMIDAESLRVVAEGFSGCGSLEIPEGASIRLRMDKFHSYLQKPFEFGLKQRELISLDFVIAVTFHDGNNIFSIPGTQTAYVMFQKDGKAKFFALAGAYGSCWIDL